MRACTVSGPAGIALFLSACAAIHPLNSAPAAMQGRVITEEMIAASGAATAWDVLQQGGYYRMISDGRGGRYGVHSKRGKTSMLLANSDVPRLIIDGARLSDLSQLRVMSANSIAWIQLLGGIDGGSEEGQNSGAGVIRIVSKVGR